MDVESIAKRRLNVAGGTHVHNEGSVCVREESGFCFGNGVKRQAHSTTTGNNLIRSILVQIGWQKSVEQN